MRRAWPEVLERLRELRKTPWTFIKDNTEPLDINGDVLLLGVRSSRLRDTLAGREDYNAYLQQAMADVLGRPLTVEAVVNPGGPVSDPPPRRPPAGRPRQPEGQSTDSPRRPGTDEPTDPVPTPATSDVDPADPVLDEMSGADLLSRELGASIIDVVDEQ